jgi:hypothetical protein
MEYGNWEVTEEGIQGLDNMSKYFITKVDMIALDGNGCVDILVHTARIGIVNEHDIVNLNNAYRQALYSFGIESITDDIMVKTIKEQQKHL